MLQGSFDELVLEHGDQIVYLGQPFADDPMLGVSATGHAMAVVQRPIPSSQFREGVVGVSVIVDGRPVGSFSIPGAGIEIDESVVQAFLGPSAAALARRGVYGDSLEAYRELRKTAYIPRMALWGTLAVRDQGEPGILRLDSKPFR